MISSRPYSAIFCSASCHDYFWEAEAELFLLIIFPDYSKTWTFERYKKYLAESRKSLEELCDKWINIPGKTKI